MSASSRENLITFEKGGGLIEYGQLYSGNIYELDLLNFMSDILKTESYLDRRITSSFVKKIMNEESVPLVLFTKVDMEFKIVSGIHVVRAVCLLDRLNFKGVYISPALPLASIENTL